MLLGHAKNIPTPPIQKKHPVVANRLAAAIFWLVCLGGCLAKTDLGRASEEPSERPEMSQESSPRDKPSWLLHPRRQPKPHDGKIASERMPEGFLSRTHVNQCRDISHTYSRCLGDSFCVSPRESQTSRDPGLPKTSVSSREVPQRLSKNFSHCGFKGNPEVLQKYPRLPQKVSRPQQKKPDLPRGFPSY